MLSRTIQDAVMLNNRPQTNAWPWHQWVSVLENEIRAPHLLRFTEILGEWPASAWPAPSDQIEKEDTQTVNLGSLKRAARFVANAESWSHWLKEASLWSLLANIAHQRKGRYKDAAFDYVFLGSLEFFSNLFQILCENLATHWNAICEQTFFS